MAVAIERSGIRRSALRLNLLIITLTGVPAFLLLVRHGMMFDWTSAGAAVGTILLLAPFAVIFDRRGVAPFVNLLTGFLCMVAFNVFLTILTYAGTPLNAPLADDWLMQCDAAMGVHLPSIVSWAANHPTIRLLFDVAYPSVMFSTLLALVVLGLDTELRRMQEFVLTFMLSGLLTTVVFFCLPAEGPFAAYGYAPRPDQQNFLNHFHALRAGQFPVVSLNHIEGLITFPSFHTSWALLLAWGFRHHRWLRIPMLILNLMVVISTLTTGWHYASDVIGGAAVAAMAVFLTQRLRPWLQDDLPPTAEIESAVSDRSDTQPAQQGTVLPTA